MLCVITGASGFVGSHVVRALVASGVRVRALTRGTPAAADGVEWMRYEGLGDRDALQRAMAGADAIVHLAARVHVMQEYASDPEAAFRAINVDGTQAILDAASHGGIARVLLASSVKAVAERSDAPLDESTPPRPLDAYGRSKLAAEARLREWSGGPGRSGLALRLPLVYGPGVGANVLRLFHLVDRGLPVPVVRPSNRRSLVFVGNVADAIVRLLSAPALARFDAPFVSDGPAVSTADLVRAVARALGRRPRLLTLPRGALMLGGRVGDVLARVAPWPVTSAALARLTDSLEVSDARLRTVYGVARRFDLEEGLRETAGWYRSGAPARHVRA